LGQRVSINAGTRQPSCSPTIHPQRIKNAFSLIVHLALIVHVDQAVAELMATCPKCGAVTSYSLELAWRLRSMTCRECSLSVRLEGRDLRGLRDRLVEARVRIDRLIDTGPVDD
jgi:hypothetical protein